MKQEDKMIKAISNDGFIRLRVLSLRHAVERMRNMHRTTPVVTAALGRTMAAASMLGANQKEENSSVTLRINGGGPIGSVIAVSDAGGNVRAYAQNPQVVIDKRPDGKLNVGGAVGVDGLLTVTRDLGFGDPYVGSTALVSGEIGEDLAAYLVESEQIGAAVGLGVLVDVDQSVIAAGGYIVELLPGADDAMLEKLEQNVMQMGTVTDFLRERDAERMVETLLDGFQPEILETSPVEYRCYCSKERVEQALRSIGAEALTEMAEDTEDTLVNCQFCDIEHRFTPSEIAALTK